jgi:TldD protein
LALQIHESCGHPAELDRVLGYEANFAGTSFLTKDKRNALRYSSDIVNLYADARPEHLAGAGTFAYDDEGVAAQRTDLVKNGIFVNYLFSRDTAAEIGEQRSNGCMRASSWNRTPLIRQTNVCLEPGNWELEALIADTKNGILMQTNKSWSIDDKRENFQFGTEIAWEIRNGKKTRILKNPTYTGVTTDFWQSCDAICNKDEWQLWGIPNCGKGQPEQVIAISHGAAPARFRNINVGGSRVK